MRIIKNYCGPITDGEEMSWRWSKEKVSAESHNIIVERTKSNGINLFKKQRPGLGNLPTKKPKSLFYKPEYFFPAVVMEPLY